MYQPRTRRMARATRDKLTAMPILARWERWGDDGSGPRGALVGIEDAYGNELGPDVGGEEGVIVETPLLPLGIAN
jgi:hypothetical protein